MLGPATDGSTSLGNTSYHWSGLYLGTNDYAYFADDEQEFIYGNDTALIFGAGGAGQVNLNTTTFRPTSDGSQDLGTSTVFWGTTYSDLFVAQSGGNNVGGITFYGGATNYVSLYQDAADRLVLATDDQSNGDLTFRWGYDDGYGYDWIYTGSGSGDANYLELWSHAGAGTDYLVMRVHQTSVDVDWAVDMLPSGTRNLGASGTRWNYLYADNVDTNDIRLSNGMIWREDGYDTFLMNEFGRELFRIKDNGDVIAYGSFTVSDEVIMHDVDSKAERMPKRV
jgi:hypothetical protein